MPPVGEACPFEQALAGLLADAQDHVFRLRGAADVLREGAETGRRGARRARRGSRWRGCAWPRLRGRRSPIGGAEAPLSTQPELLCARAATICAPDPRGACEDLPQAHDIGVAAVRAEALASVSGPRAVVCDLEHPITSVFAHRSLRGRRQRRQTRGRCAWWGRRRAPAPRSPADYGPGARSRLSIMTESGSAYC